MGYKSSAFLLYIRALSKTTCVWNNSQQCTECSAILSVLCWNQRFDRSEIWGSSSFSLQHFAAAVRRWFTSTICAGIPHDIWIKVKSTAWGFLSAAVLLWMPCLIIVRRLCVQSIRLEHVTHFAFAVHPQTCHPPESLNEVTFSVALLQLISLF